MKRCKTQMKRVLELHRCIQRGEYPNCVSFAKRWEVTSKTIQRDIDYLRDQMDAPIEYDDVKRGYYYTDPCFMLPAVSMNEGELLAIVLGTRALEAYRGTPMAAKLEGVLHKLAELLPSEVMLNPSELFSQFSFSAPPSIPVNPEVWEVVLAALQAKRQLEVDYNGKTRRIHPLHMANLQGQWYLFARFYDYDNFRQLSMGRIQSSSMLADPVDAVGFVIEDQLKDTMGRFAGDNESFSVVLKFAAEVADSVMEREWHPNQQTRELDDGSVELSFSAKGAVEVKGWIMAWGRYCQVQSPAWIKEMIAEEVEAMASLIKEG